MGALLGARQYYALANRCELPERKQRQDFSSRDGTGKSRARWRGAGAFFRQTPNEIFEPTSGIDVLRRRGKPYIHLGSYNQTLKL
jgi:hypothetical protein